MSDPPAADLCARLHEIALSLRGNGNVVATADSVIVSRAAARIAEQDAEIERLRAKALDSSVWQFKAEAQDAEIERLRAIHTKYTRETVAALEAHAARCRELEQDAARYRWLRTYRGGDRSCTPWAMIFDDDLQKHIDAAIDAARKENAGTRPASSDVDRNATD